MPPGSSGLWKNWQLTCVTGKPEEAEVWSSAELGAPVKMKQEWHGSK
jgi:hypothetical protein